ncbi:hypothetical protein [Marinovum sp.]|uniref:hypothetical protein n=1 Tax=Marinovum sp. TaxID=2024839 RepID=UPI002B27317B|nr:hypothetical protein [Marinovum sp.]
MKFPVGKLSLGKLSIGRARKGTDAAPQAAAPAAPEAPEAPAKVKFAHAKGKFALPKGKFALPKGKLALPRSIPINRSTVALGSGVIIFSVGFVLQNFGTHPAGSLSAAQPSPSLQDSFAGGMDLEAITPTSASILPMDRPLPPLPRDAVAAQVADTLPADTDTGALAALEDTAVPAPLSPAPVAGPTPAARQAQSVPALPCEITMTADPAPAAMVDLRVEAACLPDARFTLHHNGMMFHALTDDDGRTSLRVPALARNAVFIASFDNSEGAVAQIDVPTLEFYDRAVAQWRGHAGLGLHALEFDAGYFGAGHVHSASPSDMSAAASGTSGFLTRFGENAGADALMAEVYTFPSRTSNASGRIGLSVEAEVTAANCGKEIDAQTLQLKPGAQLRTQDVTLYMPACDASGDFLVLKNLFEDLKVAAN